MPKPLPQLIQASEDNLPNSFLQPSWPGDLPRECPCCGKRLDPRINLTYGYGRLGRTCQLIAHWITLPWLPVLFLLVLPWLMTLPGGNGAGFALCILIILPAVAFAVITRLCPHSRRIRCFPCGYSMDYPFSPKRRD